MVSLLELPLLLFLFYVLFCTGGRHAGVPHPLALASLLYPPTTSQVVARFTHRWSVLGVCVLRLS